MGATAPERCFRDRSDKLRLRGIGRVVTRRVLLPGDVEEVAPLDGNLVLLAPVEHDDPLDLRRQRSHVVAEGYGAVVANIDHRREGAALQAQPLLAYVLGNRLIELHRRAFASDEHDDGVALTRRDAETDHVGLIRRNVLPRDKFELRVNLDHRSSA